MAMSLEKFLVSPTSSYIPLASLSNRHQVSSPTPTFWTDLVKMESLAPSVRVRSSVFSPSVHLLDVLSQLLSPIALVASTPSPSRLSGISSASLSRSRLPVIGSSLPWAASLLASVLELSRPVFRCTSLSLPRRPSVVLSLHRTSWLSPWGSGRLIW